MKFSTTSKEKVKNKIYYYGKDEEENKYFGKKYLDESDGKEKILNEVKFLNLLSKYNFVPKVKFFNLKDCLILYENIEGQNLKNKIYDIDETIQIILQICNILEKIHMHGYIYGDLKPSNIIMTGKNLMLVDYESVTEIGKPLYYYSKVYCSPYQKVILAAVYQFDLYSLGIVFLELLIGYDKIKYYFDKNKISEINPNEIIINLPLEINNIIKRLLSPSIKDNYSNVLEVRKELLDYVGKGEKNANFNN